MSKRDNWITKDDKEFPNGTLYEFYCKKHNYKFSTPEICKGCFTELEQELATWQEKANEHAEKQFKLEQENEQLRTDNEEAGVHELKELLAHNQQLLEENERLKARKDNLKESAVDITTSQEHSIQELEVELKNALGEGVGIPYRCPNCKEMEENSLKYHEHLQKANNKIGKLEQELEEKKTKWKQDKKRLVEKCDEQYQNLHKDKLDAMREVERLKSILKERDEKIAELQKELDVVKEDRDECVNKIKDYKSTMDYYEAELHKAPLPSEVTALEEALATTRRQLASYRELKESLERKYKGLYHAYKREDNAKAEEIFHKIANTFEQFKGENPLPHTTPSEDAKKTLKELESEQKKEQPKKELTSKDWEKGIRPDLSCRCSIEPFKPKKKEEGK